MDEAITVRGLRKRYADKQAVDGLDLDIHLGEVFAFLGPNGAGKTTTVEILEGFRRRDAGEVSVLGTDPQRAGLAWRNRIGIVLQSTGGLDLLTPREQDGGLVCLGCFRRPPAPTCVRCKRSTRSGAEGGYGLVCPPCWRWLRLSDEEQAAVIARRKRQYQASKHWCDRCGRTAVISLRRAEESVCKTCATRAQVVCAACGLPRTSRRNIHDRSRPRCGDTQLCTCPVCDGQRFG